MNPAWIAAVCALTGIMLTVIGWLGRRTWRGFNGVSQFLQDWNGRAADRGHEARAGVLERLTSLEHGLADVQGQVHLNSGHSLRDEVQRTEAAVGELTTRVSSLQDSVDELKGR